MRRQSNNQWPVPSASRLEDILDRLWAGETLEQIGKRHGITRERVRQLAAAVGYDAKRGMRRRTIGRHPWPKPGTRLAEIVATLQARGIAASPVRGNAVDWWAAHKVRCWIELGGQRRLLRIAYCARPGMVNAEYNYWRFHLGRVSSQWPADFVVLWCGTRGPWYCIPKGQGVMRHVPAQGPGVLAWQRIQGRFPWELGWRLPVAVRSGWGTTAWR